MRQHPDCSYCRHDQVEVTFADGPLKGERKFVEPQHSMELQVALPPEFRVADLSAGPVQYTRTPIGIYKYKRHIGHGRIEMEFRGVRV